MGLLEKAKKYLKNDKTLNISLEEFRKAKKETYTPRKKKKYEKYVSNFDKTIDKNLSPIKIQQEEVNTLFKRDITIKSNIEIVDIIMSNFKIFYNNILNKRHFMDAIEYLRLKFEEFFFISKYLLYFNDRVLPSNSDEELVSLTELIHHQSRTLSHSNSIINLKEFFSLKSNIYFFPIVAYGSYKGYLIFKLDINKNIIDNEYYIDVMEIIFNSILNFIIGLNKKKQDFNHYINNNDSIIEITRFIHKNNINELKMYKINNLYSILNSVEYIDQVKFFDMYYQFIEDNNYFLLQPNIIFSLKENDFKNQFNEFLLFIQSKKKALISDKMVDVTDQNKTIPELLKLIH